MSDNLEHREHQRREDCKELHTEMKKFKNNLEDPKDGVIKTIRDERECGDKRLHQRIDTEMKSKVGIWVARILIAVMLASFAYTTAMVRATDNDVKDLDKEHDTLATKEDVKEVKEAVHDNADAISNFRFIQGQVLTTLDSINKELGDLNDKLDK